MDYHSGERWVQAELGVSSQAQMLADQIGDRLYPRAAEFLRQQRLAVVATCGSSGHVWASLLCGNPGFITATDEHHVTLAPEVLAADPLWDNLAPETAVGLIIMDFERRRRLRINGTVVQLQSDHRWQVATQQVYFNCPKYIQSRCIVGRRSPVMGKPHIIGTSLTPEQIQLIQQSDTFFIASFHPTAGLDASHRGGPIGFTQVLSPTAIQFPDYAGNNLFNTIGNLAVDPRCGLLFLDFDRGESLQITGQTTLHWHNSGEIKSQTDRSIQFNIQEVRQTHNADPWLWTFLEASPYNP